MKEKRILIEACINCGFFHKHRQILEVVGFCTYFRKRIEYLVDGKKPPFCRLIALIAESE